jgi:hypothetical protein
MRRENCKEEHNKLSRDPLGGRSSLGYPHQSSPMQLHCVKTLNTSNHSHHRWEERLAAHASVSATTGIS